MRFHLATLLALCATAFAADPNPFNIPKGGLSASAGQPLTLQWQPTTSGTVSLILRSGSSNNLNEGTIIASNIANSGSYTWTPTNAFTRGSDYTIEIVDDSDPSLTNYTPYFVLDTSNTVASATPTVTIGAQTSTSIASQTSTSGVTTTTASSATMTTTTKSKGMETKTTHHHGSSGIFGTKLHFWHALTVRSDLATSSMASSSMGSTSSASAASSSNAPTPPSATNGAAARASAALGMLGVVALGALAL